MFEDDVPWHFTEVCLIYIDFFLKILFVAIQVYFESNNMVGKLSQRQRAMMINTFHWSKFLMYSMA